LWLMMEYWLNILYLPRLLKLGVYLIKLSGLIITKCGCSSLVPIH
jgi:hypothetical protein